MMQRTISRDELKRKIKRGDDFILVDTLGSDYYLHSHLPSAINLSLEYVDEAPKMLTGKDAEIIVYCMSDM